MQEMQERQSRQAGRDAAALLTSAQVGAALGIDQSTVYRMAADGRLRAVKVGRQWRFPAGTVDELLSGTTPVAAGTDQAAKPAPVTLRSWPGSTPAPSSPAGSPAAASRAAGSPAASLTTAATPAAPAHAPAPTAATPAAALPGTAVPTAVGSLAATPITDAPPDAPQRAAGRSAPDGIDTAAALAAVAVAAELLGVMMVVTDMAGKGLTPVANPCRRFAAVADEPAAVATCAAEWRALADDVDLQPRFRPGALGFECARSYVRSGDRLVAMVLAGGLAPEDDDDPDLYHLDPEAREAVLAALPRVAAALSRVGVRTR